MFDAKIGIDPNLSKIELNQLLRGTVTRIRRCVGVKNVALQKIREDDIQSRNYGFKHINWIINKIQIPSYLSYINRLREFLRVMQELRPRFDSLEPLEKGFLKRMNFNSLKAKIQNNIIELEQKIPSIEQRANQIYENVMFQQQLLRTQMTGEQEAQLRAKITLEIEESQGLIKQLNECMSLAFKAINNFNGFQLGFLRFLKRCKATKGANIIDDSETVVRKIQDTVSFFYAIKTQLLLTGLAIGFFSSSETASNLGYALSKGIIGVDAVMDGLAALPAQRKIAKNILRLVGALKQRQESLTRQFVRVVQANPLVRTKL